MRILSEQASIDKLEGLYLPATTLDSVNHTLSNDNSQHAVLGRIRDNFPAELIEFPQWVVWRYEHSPKRRKPAKAPYSPTGRRASVDDPATWGTFENCADAYLTGKFSGMGFVFTEQAGITGIDLDDCIVDGYTLDWAIDVLRMFAGSYAEYSVSGTGVHILVRSTAGTVGARRNGIEVYSGLRFFVVTGDRLIVHPSAIAACPDGLTAVLAMVQKEEPKQQVSTGVCDAPILISSAAPAMADHELLQRMFGSRNGAAIRSLWDGNTGDDPSAADLALCNHLAFWTGGDAVQIDAMFRRSGLYRPKWDKKHSQDGRTYGAMTIDRAVADTRTVYTGKASSTPVVMVNISNTKDIASTGGGDVAPCPGSDAPDSMIAYPLEHVIAVLQYYVHTINFADHVPAEKQAANGYRTREPDLAIADAILETFAGYGKLNGPLGLRQLRRAANLGGLATTHRALDRLTPWLVRPVETKGAADAANVYEVSPELIAQLLRTWNTTHTPPPVDTGVPSTQQIYSEYRAADPFSATTAPITPQDIADRETAGRPYSERYQLTGIYKRRLQAALSGAGRTALVIVSALVGAGGSLPMCEIVGLGGRSKFTVSRAISRLEFLQMVTLDRTGVTLRSDWQDWLTNIAELMPTHGNGERRLVRDALRTIESCEQVEQDAKENGKAAPVWVGKRKERAEMVLKRFAPIYWQLHQERISAVPTGRVHTGKNGFLLVEQLPELRRWARPIAA